MDQLCPMPDPAPVMMMVCAVMAVVSIVVSACHLHPSRGIGGGFDGPLWSSAAMIVAWQSVPDIAITGCRFKVTALQFAARVFLIETVFQIKRGHPRIAPIVEPFLRPIFPVGADICHDRASGLWTSPKISPHIAIRHARPQALCAEAESGQNAGAARDMRMILPKTPTQSTGSQSGLFSASRSGFRA